MVIAMGLAVQFIPNTAEVMNNITASSTTPVIEEEIEVDVVESAKAELERINIQLDEEEVKLLEQKTAIEAEKAAQLSEIEERLEQIRETRTSF